MLRLFVLQVLKGTFGLFGQSSGVEEISVAHVELNSKPSQ